MNIPIKLLEPDMQIPKYAHIGDAGLDLSASHDATIKPFQRVMVHCGFCIAIPEGYAGVVFPRSGLASKHGITLVNSPGLIDSGYRGEIMVPLINLDANETFQVNKGDRVAQLVIIEVPKISLTDNWKDDETERGLGGFGSSGLNSNI